MLDTLSPVNDVHRRDVEVDDPDALLDPTETTTALEAGEWVKYDSTTGKAIRGAGPTDLHVMQVFSQKGDFAAQAIDKVATLFLHEYEAETDMYDPAGTFSIGTELTIWVGSIDGVTRAALSDADTAGQIVQAICTKPPQDNGNKLRFVRVSPFYKHA